MKARRGIVLLPLVLLVSVPAGCAGSLSPEPESCVSWIDVSDPDVAYEEADAVVVGTTGPATGSIEMFGIDAAVHQLAVTEVVKGDLDEVSVPVASTPVTCTGNTTYPEGDPLDVEGPVIVFLAAPDDGATWSLVTPQHTNVLPLPADGRLPFETGG